MGRIINGIGLKYIERSSYMLPCLNKESLKLLVGTADERYQYSPEYFRNTHFPQMMHRYLGDQLVAEITESELLQDLIEVDTTGNRVFLVFGSTGSGKSELLCWIKDNWVQQNNRPVIRISRSELNPQVLIKKCFEILGVPLKINVDESRWDLLLRKPVTLINQIVWTTLAETLETDDEIIPVALLIRPIIERNVIEFTKQIERGHVKKPLEIIHKEQFEELISSTTLTLNIDYESFRQNLTQRLDHFLFEGWDIGSLFKQISIYLKVNNIRPLLLIDDLVQSVNIYATELLDQLITLEEGNWDVVIGLTPGTIQDSKRGIELTKRIRSLDTIDDRVKKLWLSDESGKDFYNLDRNQVVPYMANYLKQLKNTQGYTCSKKCSHYLDCRSLVQVLATQEDSEDDLAINLLPFTRHMIKRVYDAIPIGKGKLRYMILNSKEIIRFFQKGRRQLISRVLPLVKRETFADHSDLLVKTMSEWYVQEGSNKVVFPRQLLKHFGYHIEDLSVNLQSIGHLAPIQRPSSETDLVINNLDHSFVIRDWAEGKKTNLELLEPVRFGVASLVHDVVKAIDMSRPFTPRTTSIIQRKEISNRSRYPITFVEKDAKSFGGIEIKRGYSALEVTNFQQLKPAEKVKLFLRISNEHDTARWIFQADTLHLLWRNKLEEELGMTLPSFAYHFKNWVTEHAKFNQVSWTRKIKSPFSLEVINLSEQLFQDWFLLRDNMRDSVGLNEVKVEPVNFINWIREYNPSKELEQFGIGDISLFVFLSEIKEKYNLFCETLSKTLRETLEQRSLMVPYLLSSKDADYQHIASEIARLRGKSNFEIDDFIDYSKIEESVESRQILAQFSIDDVLRKEVRDIVKKYELLSQQLVSITNGYGENLSFKEVSKNTSWKGLNEEKEKYMILNDELTRLTHCLNLTPKITLAFLMTTHIESTEILHIKKLWSNLMESGRRLLEQKTIGHNLIHVMVGWQSIDFHEIRNRVQILTQKEIDRSNLLEIVRSDLGYENVTNINQLIDAIESNQEIRPALRRQLRNLLEHGNCTLPPVQWKKLLDDLKEMFPNLFRIVEIRLVANTDIYKREA
ncbi:hypothetical protein [Brevibacillus sp. MS2.2]|uniref:hypothetical protein n=1 Tax=Brevibacillus sp. MS2.2 TaxID=2738981 RepID=UPI0020C446F0|nr:hypothetical protein [Brevibacillus sp. MS2.2]